MTGSDPVAERIVLDVLTRLTEDRLAGRHHDLPHYQALHPAHAALIAREWQTLTDELPSTDGADHCDPASGRRLGPYRLHEVLGRGGQGVVHRAVDERIGRTVALKLLPASPSSAGLPARVRRELEAIARLDHPGLCVVYEAGVLEGQVYLAMRYVRGRTLAALLSERAAGHTTGDSRSRRERLTADLGLVETLARALHAAHEAGVVHRDVKPANVIVHESGEPVLLDFGLARADDSELATLTASGELLGTTAYMAPERLAGQGDDDRRGDVWSLGVLLYELLTGRRPFEGPGLDDLSRRIRLEEPGDPRRLDRAIPRDLAVVLGAALEKDPARRYPSAQVLADELARVAAGLPVLARPPTPLGRLRRWAWRHPALAALWALLFVGATASVVAALAFRDLATREREARRQGEALNAELQTQGQALAETAAREASARADAEVLLVQRAAEQARLLADSDTPGRRWRQLTLLGNAAATRAALPAARRAELPDLPSLRGLATAALLTPDARLDRVIQRSSLGTGRFNADGERLVLTWVAPDFSDGGLRVLDTTDGRELRHMAGLFLLSNAFSATLSDDDAYVVVPRSDAVSLWSTADAGHRAQLEIPPEIGATDAVSRWEVAFLPGERYLLGVAAPDRDPARPLGWVIWDLTDGRVVQLSAGTPGQHDWFVLDAPGGRVLVPDGPRGVTRLALPAGPRGLTRLGTLQAPASVRAAALGPPDDPSLHLLLRDDDGTDSLARLAPDGSLLARRELPLRGAQACGLLRRSPDGRLLALAAEDGSLHVADAYDLSPILTIPAVSHRELEDLRFGADGRELLGHSSREGSEAWELLADPGLVTRLADDLRADVGSAFSADGSRGLVLPAADDRPCLVGARDPLDAVGLPLPIGAAAPTHLALGADGSALAAAAPGACWTWTAGDALPRSLALPPDAVPLALALPADVGPRLLVRRADGRLQWHEPRTERAETLDQADADSHWITPGPRLERALLVPRDGVRPPLRLARGALSWCALPAGQARPLAGLDPAAFKQVFAARFAADAPRLVAAVYVPLEADDGRGAVQDCRLLCWDLDDDALLWELPIEARAAQVAPALDASARLVAVAEPGGVVALHDGASGALLLRWQAHADSGLAELHLLADGDLLVTRSVSGELKRWELATLLAELAALGLGLDA